MTKIFSGSRKLLLWGVWLLAAVVLLVLTLNSGLKFQNFELSNQKGITRPVEMPYLAPGWGPGDYRLTGQVVLELFAPKTLQVVPDDQLLELIVNGVPADLSALPPERLRDVQRGVTLDLGPLLHTGVNQVEFVFREFGGDMGMALKRSPQDWRVIALLSGWGLLVAIAFVAVLRRFGVSAVRSLMYLLILFGNVVQVWFIFTYNPVNHIFSDPARHWEQGIDVLRIDLMSLTDPIAYQLYIAFLAKFTLKMPVLVAYCTSILALLAPWTWYRFFRELQTSKTLALAGWAFLSLLPSWMAIYGYFMQETLLLPLLGAALWATWRCRRKGDVASFGWMVFFWIAAGLTRGIAIPMAAVACTWLWFAQDLKIKKAFYSSLILLAIMGPLTYRAYQTVHHFAPHGMGHLNVIYAQSGKKTIEISVERSGARWGLWFGSPSTGAEPFAPFSDWKTRREGTVRIKVDLDEGMRDWKTEMDKTDLTWSDYAWITGENLIFLFFAESWPDNNKAQFVAWVGAGMRWIWAPTLLLMVLGTALYARRFRGHWMLPAMISAWFVVQALVPISVNEGRYRKPFEGLAVAQIILLLAVRKGAARPAAPSLPWRESIRPYRQYLPSRKKTVEE